MDTAQTIAQHVVYWAIALTLWAIVVTLAAYALSILLPYRPAEEWGKFILALWAAWGAGYVLWVLLS